MRRRVVAILNPVSGRRNMLPVVRQVGRFLERAGGRLELQTTNGAGHATRIAAGVADDVDAVLAVGGDGTASEVVNGLIDRQVPMVILRTGTENLLARELGMPTAPRLVAETLLHGEPFGCDVGVMNKRHVVAVAGVGFDAECVVRMSNLRQGHITHWDYFWPIWRTFWSHSFPNLRVEVEGDLFFEGRGLALVGVIGQYSVGLRLLAHARFDDGLLDLVVMPCSSRVQLVGHTCRAFLRRHVGRGGVLYRQCRRFRISSPEPVPVQVDGEVGGELPADFSILPGAVRFLRPNLPG